MPSWAIHVAVSEELSKNMSKKEKEEFTLGNLLPDINNGFLIPDVSKKIVHDITHYAPNCNFRDMQNIRQLFENYKKLCYEMKEKLKEPMVYGYFAHLLTDYYWNHYTYVEKGVLDGNRVIGIKRNDQTVLYGDSEEIRQTKVNDFNLFSKYLYQNQLPKVKFTEENLKEKVKEIPIVSVQQSDIEKVNAYFEHIDEKLQQIDTHYTFYTQEEFEKCLKENVEFIRKMLKFT